MTTNKTSGVVKDLAQGIQPTDDHVSFSGKYLVAIAEKYQKMEEALKEIAYIDETDCPKVADDVLSFDPLA